MEGKLDKLMRLLKSQSADGQRYFLKDFPARLRDWFQMDWNSTAISKANPKVAVAGAKEEVEASISSAQIFADMIKMCAVVRKAYRPKAAGRTIYRLSGTPALPGGPRVVFENSTQRKAMTSWTTLSKPRVIGRSRSMPYDILLHFQAQGAKHILFDWDSIHELCEDLRNYFVDVLNVLGHQDMSLTINLWKDLSHTMDSYKDEHEVVVYLNQGEELICEWSELWRSPNANDDGSGWLKGKNAQTEAQEQQAHKSLMSKIQSGAVITDQIARKVLDEPLEALSAEQQKKLNGCRWFVMGEEYNDQELRLEVGDLIGIGRRLTNDYLTISQTNGEVAVSPFLGLALLRHASPAASDTPASTVKLSMNDCHPDPQQKKELQLMLNEKGQVEHPSPLFKSYSKDARWFRSNRSWTVNGIRTGTGERIGVLIGNGSLFTLEIGSWITLSLFGSTGVRRVSVYTTPGQAMEAMKSSFATLTPAVGPNPNGPVQNPDPLDMEIVEKLKTGAKYGYGPYKQEFGSWWIYKGKAAFSIGLGQAATEIRPGSVFKVSPTSKPETTYTIKPQMGNGQMSFVTYGVSGGSLSMLLNASVRLDESYKFGQVDLGPDPAGQGEKQTIDSSRLKKGSEAGDAVAKQLYGQSMFNLNPTYVKQLLSLPHWFEYQGPPLDLGSTVMSHGSFWGIQTSVSNEHEARIFARGTGYVWLKAAMINRLLDKSVPAPTDKVLTTTPKVVDSPGATQSKPPVPEQEPPVPKGKQSSPVSKPAPGKHAIPKQVGDKWGASKGAALLSTFQWYRYRPTDPLTHEKMELKKSVFVGFRPDPEDSSKLEALSARDGQIHRVAKTKLNQWLADKTFTIVNPNQMGKSLHAALARLITILDNKP